MSDAKQDVRAARRQLPDARDRAGSGREALNRDAWTGIHPGNHRTADLELDHASLLRQRRHELLRHLYKPVLTRRGALRRGRPGRPRLQLPPPTGERVGVHADSRRVRLAALPARPPALDPLLPDRGRRAAHIGGGLSRLLVNDHVIRLRRVNHGPLDQIASGHRLRGNSDGDESN